MMGEIYSKARKVLLWLGNPSLDVKPMLETDRGLPRDWVPLPEILNLQKAPNDCNSEPVIKDTRRRPVERLKDIVLLKGMTLAATLGEFPGSIWKPGDQEKSSDPLETPPNIAALLADQSAWAGLEQIFLRKQSRDSYFRRRWVVQECTQQGRRGRVECHLGRFSIKLESLSQAVNVIDLVQHRSITLDVLKHVPQHSIISMVQSLSIEFRALYARNLYLCSDEGPRLQKPHLRAVLDFVLKPFSHGECQDP